MLGVLLVSAGCLSAPDERAAAGIVGGKAYGYGEACTERDATKAATEDAVADCGRLAPGGTCMTMSGARCFRGLRTDCPGGGVQCTSVAFFNRPDDAVPGPPIPGSTGVILASAFCLDGTPVRQVATARAHEQCQSRSGRPCDRLWNERCVQEKSNGRPCDVCHVNGAWSVPVTAPTSAGDGGEGEGEVEAAQTACASYDWSSCCLPCDAFDDTLPSADCPESACCGSDTTDGCW